LQKDKPPKRKSKEKATAPPKPVEKPVIPLPQPELPFDPQREMTWMISHPSPRTWTKIRDIFPVRTTLDEPPGGAAAGIPRLFSIPWDSYAIPLKAENYTLDLSKALAEFKALDKGQNRDNRGRDKDKELHVVYARVFVFAAQDRLVEVRTFGTGPIKVWLNTELVVKQPPNLQRPFSPNRDQDDNEGEVTLHKGTNRLLVKAAQSAEPGPWKISVRLVDHGGKPLDGNVQFSDQAKPPRPADQAPMPEK